MKTLLFCTAWSDHTLGLDSRVGRWVRHHSGLPYPCEVKLAAIGDGIAPEIAWPDGDYHRVNLEPHLGRPSHLDYPGWWRSFTHAAAVARELGCRRIWHVESDFFLASWRMLCKMNEIEEGWIGFWCHRHSFPETAIQVIGEEHFDTLARFAQRASEFVGQHAESVVPFTTIVKDMVGDRYGEWGRPPAEIGGLDFYGQLPAHIEPLFRR